MNGDEAALGQSIEDPDTKLARNMVVANARVPKGRILWSRANARVAQPFSNVDQVLYGASDIGSRQGVVTMPACAPFDDETSLRQSSKMRAGRLRAHARFPRQLSRSQRLARHKRRNDVRPRRVTQQRRHDRKVRSILHASILIEMCRNGNAVSLGTEKRTRRP